MVSATTFAHDIEVENDGTVDVADIATIIDAIASKSREQKTSRSE